MDDPVNAARTKPFAVLGEALSGTYDGSAVEVLRAAGLVPLSVEIEPALTSKVVAAADGWAIWQLTLVLNPGTERRW